MEKILIFVEVDPPLREPKVYRKLVRVPDLTGRHIVGVNDQDVDVFWPLQHICPVQCSPIVVEDRCEWSRSMAPEQGYRAIPTVAGQVGFSELRPPALSRLYGRRFGGAGTLAYEAKT